MRIIFLYIFLFVSAAAAQPALTHGERPKGFHETQQPTEQSAALLEPLEVVYPDSAMKRQWEGVALIAAWIDPDGYVPYAEVHESSGHHVLDSIALSAVLRGNYRAAQRAGRRVGSRVSIPVEFRVRRDVENFDTIKSEEQLQQETEELRRARSMLEEEQRRVDAEIRRLKQRHNKDTLRD